MTTGNIRYAVALVAAFAFAPLQSAQADNVKVFVDGIGVAKCSQITADIQEQPTAVANSLLGWTYGYMTRRNIERARAGQPQVDLPAAGATDKKLLGIILGYCEKEPETRIFQVVDAIFEVLIEKGSLTS